MLIGDLKFVGQGIGPKALLVLMSHLRQRGDAPLVGLSPSVQNIFTASICKGGFHILCEDHLLIYEPLLSDGL
jgi:hypothetical protein